MLTNTSLTDFVNKMVSLLILVFLVNLASCDVDKYPQYSITTTTVIPDSNKTKLADFIVKTVQAGSFRLSTSDYEDPEDLVWQVQKTGEAIYSVQIPALSKTYYNNAINSLEREIIPKDKLNVTDSIIFYKLDNGIVIK